MTARLAGVLAAALVVADSAATQAETGLQAGAVAPEFAGTDTSGKVVNWQRLAGRAILMLFHSEEKPFSRRGIEDLVKELAYTADWKGAIALLLVAGGGDEGKSLAESLTKAGWETLVVVDPDRQGFRDYRAIAFPTAYCIDRDRRIVHVARGHGPTFAVRVAAGMRLAAGLIDKAQFEEAIAGGAPKRDAAAEARGRRLAMARRLLGSGMLEQADDTVKQVLDASPTDPDALTLKAWIRVQQRRTDEAAECVRQLAEQSPRARELLLLQAEIALQRGQPQEAEKALQGLPGLTVDIALLRGRILEAKGDLAGAARLYREALERVLAERR